MTSAFIDLDQSVDVHEETDNSSDTLHIDTNSSIVVNMTSLCEVSAVTHTASVILIVDY